MEVSVLKFRVLDIMKLLEGKDLVYSRMQNWPRSAFLSLGGGVTEINALFLGNWSSCLGGPTLVLFCPVEGGWRAESGDG